MNTKKLINQKLSQSNGLIIGEAHSERAGVQLITDSLSDLKAQGVTCIYTEYLYEGHESLEEMQLAALAADIANQYVNQNKIPGQFSDYIATLAVAIYINDESKKQLIKSTFDQNIAAMKQKLPALQQFSNESIYNYIVEHANKGLASETAPNQYNHFNLIRKATELGIEVVPVDNMSNKGILRSGMTLEEAQRQRLVKFNEETTRKISQRQSNSAGKYVLLEGMLHGHNVMGVEGMGKRLNVPVIDVFDSTEDKEILFNQQVTLNSGFNIPSETVVQINNRQSSAQPELLLVKTEPGVRPSFSQPAAAASSALNNQKTHINRAVEAETYIQDLMMQGKKSIDLNLLADRESKKQVVKVYFEKFDKNPDYELNQMDLLDDEDNNLLDLLDEVERENRAVADNSLQSSSPYPANVAVPISSSQSDNFIIQNQDDTMAFTDKKHATEFIEYALVSGRTILDIDSLAEDAKKVAIKSFIDYKTQYQHTKLRLQGTNLGDLVQEVQEEEAQEQRSLNPPFS